MRILATKTESQSECSAKHQRCWTDAQTQLQAPLARHLTVGRAVRIPTKRSSANQHWHSDTNTSGQTPCQDCEACILFEHFIVGATEGPSAVSGDCHPHSGSCEDSANTDGSPTGDAKPSGSI
jgi:hypothetical protein